MKLVGELKEKVEMAESLEEVRQVIENAGMELTEAELESIAGGRRRTYAQISREQAGRRKAYGEACDIVQRLIKEMNSTSDPARKAEIQNKLITGTYLGFKYKDIANKLDSSVLP